MNYLQRLVLLCPLALAMGSGQLITTVAGTDIAFQGQGLPGSTVSLGRVAAVTLDPTGQAVFADPYYNLVLRIDSAGKLQVVAGNNVRGMLPTSPAGLGSQSGGGYSGDYGPAQFAALNRPSGVVYDAGGNLYIADTQNNRIRKVDTQGIITTFAGTGQAGFSGDRNAAAAATLNLPASVASDRAGNLYVYDAGNCRIRKIDAQAIITTLAGNDCNASVGALSNLGVIAADAQGNVYIPEINANRVRKITPSGQLVLVAGNGTQGYSGDNQNALLAQLNSPAGVAVDGNGNLYISDAGNSVIRMVAAATNAISTVAGNGIQGFSGDTGSALRASVANPFGIAITSGGDFYLADRDNFRIRHVDAQRNITTVAGDGLLITSRDNGPAVYAPLLDPFGVSVDGAGRLLIADTDNNVIRAVNSAGTLSTIAGTGYFQSSGDGGSALQASFESPFSANADNSGNIFIADAGGQAVRRIGPDQKVSTIASLNSNPPVVLPFQAIPDGHGNQFVADFYSGQVQQVNQFGGITVYAKGFQNPAGLALDASGALYVTDYAGGNSAGKVYKIVGGVPVVIAGGGQLTGSAAEGAAATTAALFGPSGIAVDQSGNIFFSESNRNQVREITPDGRIHTIAGNGHAGYSGDGGLASMANLFLPWGLSIDNAAGTLYIADALNNRIRAVVPAQVSFNTTSSSVNLSGISDGVLTDTVPVNVFSSSAAFPGLLFTVSTSGEKWLQVSPTSGAMPATLNIQADPTGVSPGTHNAIITITSPAAMPPIKTIAVNLSLQPPQPAQVGTDVSSISLAFVAGANATTRQVRVNNKGSGALQFTATAAADSGTGWLSVSPLSGTSSPISPQAISIRVDPSALSAGAYSGTITVKNVNGSDQVQIPISITVNALPSQILLSQTAVNLVAVAGGAAGAAQTVQILNTGLGTMAWTAQSKTLDSGTKWLALSPASGNVQTANSDFSPLSIGVDPTAIPSTPGTYYGTVQVLSNTAGNSPQAITVQLTVLAAGSPLPPQVQPSALTFVGTSGASPSAKIVTIANLTGGAMTYNSSRSTDDGQNWLINTPTNGNLTPSQQASMVVQPDYTNLTPGVYHGVITLRFASSSATVNVVAIALGGAGASSAAALDGVGPQPRASGCSNPAPLRVQVQDLSTPFSLNVGAGVPLSVSVNDNCGNPVTTGQVFAHFNNGDKDLYLDHTQSGIWTKTWTPSQAQSSMRMIVFATTAVGVTTIGGQSDILSGSMTTGKVPLVFAGGVVSAAAYGRAAPAIAPCGFVSIFGSGLAAKTDSAQTVPLPQSLGGTQVTLGGSPLAMNYVSDGVVNAVMPCDLPANADRQIIVQTAKAQSTPASFNMAAAQPAIFTTNQQGTGQGVIVNNATNQIAGPGAAVTTGDVIVIYCTGLGITDPAVASGDIPPGLAPTKNTVTLRIGQQTAQVLYAGLTPQYPGVYQINALVPQGIPAGDQTPVTVSVAGQTSPAVTMAIY